MNAPRIGIFGHYGNKNLGDEAIIEATIENLRARIPGVELVGLSINPFDTYQRYGIEAFPIRYHRQYFKAPPSKDMPCVISIPEPVTDKAQTRQTETAEPPKSFIAKLKRFGPVRKALMKIWHLRNAVKNIFFEMFFLKQIKRQLSNLDMIIVCGSNQFLDNFGGSWGFPYTILKWTMLAKLTNTKVAFVSVGAGPLDRSLSYWMLKQSLSRADHLSYRDEGSKQMIEERISGLNAPVYPDIAHSLSLMPEKSSENSEIPLVAINPMPIFDSRYWYEADSTKYDRYVNDLASFVSHILEQGNRVALFNTQVKDLNVIDDVIDKLAQRDKSLLSQLEVVKNERLQELVNLIDKADIIVATRFHATVMPLRFNKPVLGICYYRKAQELLDDVGLDNYHVDINNFSYEELKEKFDHLKDNIEEARKQVQSRYKNYHEQMNEQWIKVTGLLN